MEYTIPLLLMTVCLISGTVQGLTGFGMGIVAMSLLGLIIDIRLAAPFVALLAAVSCLATVKEHVTHVDWKEFRLLIVAILLGIPVGLWGLDALPQSLVMRLLGCSLILVCLQNFLSRKRLILPRWAGGPIGVASGVLSGAFNMGGPPLLFYLRSRPVSAVSFVATLHLLFTVSSLTRSGAAAFFGLLTTQIFVWLLLALLPTIAGIVIGSRVRRWLPEKIMNQVLLGVIFVLGCYYVLAGG